MGIKGTYINVGRPSCTCTDPVRTDKWRVCEKCEGLLTPVGVDPVTWKRNVDQ